MSFQLRNESTDEIHVLEEKRISIGSADSSNIVIKDPGVPPTQCFLSKTKLGYFLMNFSPDSHITINNEDIKEKMLKIGDRIHIGESTYLLETLAADGTDAVSEGESPPEEKAEETAPEATPEGDRPPVAEEAPPEAGTVPEGAGEGRKEGEWLQEMPTEGRDVEGEPKTAEAPTGPTQEKPPAPWEVAPEAGPSPSPEPGAPAPTPGEEGPVPMSPEEAERLFGKPAGTPDPAGAGKPPGTAPFSLKIHGGAKDGEVVEVFEKITVGRADENDVVLLSKAVSRRHAEFSVLEGKFSVRDLGSASGVMVNGARIREDTLNAGDQVEIGDIILVVNQHGEIRAEAEAPPVEAAPEAPPAEAGRVPAKLTRTVVKPMIMVMGGSLDGKIVPVVGRLSLGSSPDCDLVFSDPGIMGSHAEITELDGKASIRPLAGEVRLNGAAIEREEALSKGDTVEIGDVLLVIRETVTKVEEEAPAEPPPAEAAAPKPVDEEPPELVVGEGADDVPPAVPSKGPAGNETPPLGIAALAIEAGKPGALAPGVPPEEAKFRMVVKGGKMDGKSFPITESMTIGRESGNTIVLLDTAVSRQHAQVSPEEGGVRILDIGSTGGLWVNGKKVQEALLSHGDLLRIGHTEIQVRDISYDLLPEKEKPPLPSSMNAVKLSREEVPASDKYSLLFLKGDDAGCQYELRGNAAIGRHKSCDIVIHHDEASGKHAEIVLDGKRPVIRDQGSTNGTRVNGTRVSERYLFHGDLIELAGSEVQFREPGRPAPVAGVKRPSLILREQGSEKSIRCRMVLYSLIGRDEACSIPLRNTEASGEHADVMEKNGAYVLRDLHSTNGTKVNGTRITSETTLKHGDAIAIGTTVLYFKESEKPLPTPKGGSSVPMIVGIAVIALVVVGAALGFVFKDQWFPKSGTGPDETGERGLQENLLANGSFENLGEGWVLPAGEAEVVEDMAKDGKKCLVLAGPSSRSSEAVRDVVVHAKIHETVTTPWFNVSGFVHTENSKGYAGIRLQWTDGTKSIPGIPASFTQLITGTTDDWMHVGGTFLAPKRPEGVASMVLKLSLVAAGASGTTRFDDIRLVRMNQSDVDLRDRPELRAGSDYYTLRASDSGIFSLEQYGRPFLQNGHFILERPGERGASQFIASVVQGPRKTAPQNYHLEARIMDFYSGEEAHFEQNMTVTDDDKIKITYFLTDVPTGGGYSPAVLMGLLSPPGKFSLFDKDNRAWEFETAIDRKRGVSEVMWSVSGGDVVLSIDPPSAVETRRFSGGDFYLRILPPMGSGSRLILTFGRTSRAGEFVAEQDFEAFERAIATGDLGRAIQLGREYLENYTEMNVRRQRVKSRVEQLESVAKSKNQEASERWRSFESSAKAMEMDACKNEIAGFITQFQGLADTYESSKYAEKPKALLKAAKKMQKELFTAGLSEEVDKYHVPARKALAEGDFLRARIYLDSLKAHAGLFENMTPEMKEDYDKLRAQLEQGGEKDPETLYQEAENLLRMNEKEAAIKILRKIIALQPDDPEDGTKYSAIALKAYKKLKELR